MWTGTKKNEDFQVFQEHQSHLNRLRNIKGRTNTNPPKEVIHLKHKLKTKALRLMQESLITSDNQNLLCKMTEINSRRPVLAQYYPDQLITTLNAATRSQRITQITEENLQLLERLQSTKSRYDFKKLDQDFQYKQYLRRKVSENSRRIPKVPSFAHSASFESTKSPMSRPTTASAGLKRPSSSMCKSKQSTFELAVVKVEDMQDEMIVNCILKVVRPVISASFTTLDGAKVIVAEIQAADETGCVRVRLVNREEYLEQCERVKEGGTLVIRNSLVCRAGNLIRLEINSQSSIEQSSISFSKPINQTPHLFLNNN